MLVLPGHFTQILGHQGSFSQGLEAEPEEDAASTTTEIMTLEGGMLLVHQAQRTFKLSIKIIDQNHLKLEAPEEAIFSTIV